jgi:phosphoglycolate phosphatase-like HAD superfamily hydrolase
MAFENRTIEVEQFQRFVQAGSPTWILAFHGVAGTGKTTLLRHLRECLPAGWLPMHLDFQERFLREDYEGLVRTLAEALHAGGLPPEAWLAFQRRAEQVQELKHVNVKMDMQARNRSGIRGSVQEVRLGKEEALRVLEAARELAHAWLELVDQVQARPIAFVDHWENLLDRDSKELATWLFEDLLGRLHRWRPEFRLVIASDRPLRRDWLLFQRVRFEEVVEWEVRSWS